MATVLDSTNQRGISVEPRENRGLARNLRLASGGASGGSGDVPRRARTINKDYSSQRDVALDEITPQQIRLLCNKPARVRAAVRLDLKAGGA